MAGQKQILIKKICFVVGRGVRTGGFFIPGSPLPVCVSCSLRNFTLFIIMHRNSTDSHETLISHSTWSCNTLRHSCPTQQACARKYVIFDNLVTQNYIQSHPCILTIIRTLIITSVMNFTNSLPKFIGPTSYFSFYYLFLFFEWIDKPYWSKSFLCCRQYFFIYISKFISICLIYIVREHHKIMYLEIWWLKGENGISY